MRIVARLLVLLPLLWVEGVWAVNCSSGSYDLNTQARVDALGAENCDTVTGSLLIRYSTNITNLDSLTNLTRIGSSLQIFGTGIANVDGLRNVTHVGASILIESNLSLDNLNGLAGITSVANDLWIYRNNIRSIEGLVNIASVGGDLTIGLTAIADLDGLAGLTNVGGVQISRNGVLTSLDGLANLTSVGGDLSITQNEVLTNLDGLANLGSVEGRLTIRNHYNLANCQALAAVLGWPNGPPDDAIDGQISIGSNEPGCESVEEILASVSGPTQPVITQATTSSNSISLAFNPSTTNDTLFPITGYSASCTGSDVDVSGSPATDLLDNTPITETLTVTGYDPTSVLSSIEVDIDITHSDPTDLYITLTTPEGTELVLWNQGSSGGEDLIGTFPTTLTAVDSLDSVTRQTMDGDWVLSIEDIDVGPLVREGVLNSWGIRITEELARNDSGSPIDVFGATRGRDYTCTVAPVTKLGTTPVSDPYTVSVPLELPATPTITSTDYEDGKIILTVSVTDNGGTDITGYEATCTDGTNTYTGTSTSSPITVSGLTNDVAYTCTVTATNSVGTSSVSAATAPITPEETATGLPIWLLYQATQSN